MIKKILLVSVILSQLTISCSSDDDNTDQIDSKNNLEKQIEEILKLPYSSLTQDQQKTKLETEANAILVKLDQMQGAPAIDATNNLNRLLDLNNPIEEFVDESNDDQVSEILNLSGIYGIYTWDDNEKIWIKTASSTELKFVFPAKEDQATNNASFSTKSVSSGIKVDVDGGSQVELPSSASAALTIDGKDAASFSTEAKYSNGNKNPDAASYKMTANGYAIEMSANRTPAEAKSSLTYDGKNIIEFVTGSTANIDELLNGSELKKYLGTANGLITIMDNFVIVANTDNEGLANDIDALKNSLQRPTNYNSPTYYTDLNSYEKKFSEGMALAYNKNAKLILASKKDGTKIADLTQKSVKGYSDDFIQEYDEALYLQFNDKTEVEMGAYFSTGFNDVFNKFTDFVSGFNVN